MNASGVELKAVRLELVPETHRFLRIEAAKRDVSMAALARVFVEEGLARIAGEGAAQRARAAKKGAK